MNRETRTDAGFRQLEGEDLPIFTRVLDDLTLFYAPGYLTAAREREAEEIRQILRGELPFGNLTPAHLINAAYSAKFAWTQMQDPDQFQPTCLTLYSALGCNLGCSYCFAGHHHDELLRLDPEFIAESARVVLSNCREYGKPFTAVFHGGGEPSMDPRLFEIRNELKEMCAAVDVPFFSYIATNGVMPAEKACRIAKHFDAIGLSVDGPPAIQNAQRPLRGGGESALIVERTAAIFRAIRGQLSVRVTLPPDNFSRITEIAAYCAETLHADEIHMEPVYHRGKGLPAELADEFCENFLRSKAQLKNQGIRLTFSGSRPGEVHSRYCQIFRQVLHLVPPNAFSPCFAIVSESELMGAGMYSEDDEALFDRLNRVDPECADCFNRFHCARGCPDVCPAIPGELHDAGSFRCRVNRRIAEAELLETAQSSLADIARQYGYAGVDLRGEL